MEPAKVSIKDDKIKIMGHVYKCMHMHPCVCVCVCAPAPMHIHACKEILFSHREESNYVFCWKIVESGDHHIMQKKPDSETHVCSSLWV